MTKHISYTVGADNESRDTIRTQVVNDAGQFAVDMYMKHVYPKPYEGRKFVSGGKEVELSIRVMENTKPLGERDAE